MFILLASICTALNFIIIVHKFRLKRVADGLLDTFIMGIIGFIFIGTLGGMVIGSFASMWVSIYLWFRPVKFPKVDF